MKALYHDPGGEPAGSIGGCQVTPVTPGWQAGAGRRILEEREDDGLDE